MASHGTRPERFEYVHPPNHGSWLNLIECAFSKMARTFLRPIRVISVDELKARILKGIDEFNSSLPDNGARGFDSLSACGRGPGEGKRDVIFTCIAKSLVLLASWPRMPVDEISMRLSRHTH